MKVSHHILQELTELGSPLPHTPVTPFGGLPVGYFESLPELILSRAKAMEEEDAREELALLSPLLSQVPRVNPYTIPSGYFEELEETIPFLIHDDVVEELNTVSPLLSGMKKEMPFSVPEGYFDQLTPELMKEQRPAKVISMPTRNWMRYAAAAMIIGAIAIGSFFYLNRNTDSIDPSTKSFAWVEKNLKKVSTDDIDKFVKTTVDESPSSAIAKVEAPDEVRNLLKDVSDKEIQDFLNDTQSAESEPDDLLFN